MRWWSCPTYRQLGHLLGLQNQEYVYKHMPSRARRTDPTSWEDEGDKDIGVAIRTLKMIMEKICGLLCDGNEEATAAAWKRIARTENDSDLVKMDSFHRFLGECYSNAKRGSLEKRVVRGLLCFYSCRGLRALMGSAVGVPISNDSFVEGRKDMWTLQTGTPLNVTPRRVERYDDAVIEMAVACILSSANVSFLSWGTKKAPLDGAKVDIPALLRKRSMKAIFDSYMDHITADQTRKSTSRSTFYRIGSVLTAGGAKMRTSVDYVTGFLVNDVFELLKRIVVETELDGMQSLVFKEMEVVRAYMKYAFDRKLKEELPLSCILHDIKFGLGGTHSTVSTDLCADCKRVFMLFDDLLALLRAKGALPETLTVIADCAEKAKLFLGHRIRVINQQLEIAKIKKSMKENCIRTGEVIEALVTVDYKMKLEPMYFREKTVDHYGKRGMSWHGAMVLYYQRSSNPDASSPPIAIEQKMYLDHISKGDNLQDAPSVLSMIDAILIGIHRDLPFIKRIVLQSDNATSYQNTLLPLMLPFFSQAHPIEITGFIHTDTQDGKSVLDAHFARSMKVLLDWVKEGNNCKTPTQAVVGLKHGGGLPNCVVELVEHDRQKLAQVSSGVKRMESQLRRIIPRANEIRVIQTASMTSNTTRAMEYQDLGAFILRC